MIPWPHSLRSASWSLVQRVAGRLFVEDGAQDLVEYAFLAAFIATAGMLVLNTLGISILNTYSTWLDPSVGVPSLWAPPEPPPSGS